MKIFIVIILIVNLCKALHLFAAAQQTYLVSQSQNLKKIYKCKDQCFKLNESFPYEMKYHRIVWIKKSTDHTYMQGHCYVNIASKNQPEDWIQWTDMVKQNIIKTSRQQQIWNKFKNQCENKLELMSQYLRNVLQLTVIHSQYQFYSDGRFVNLQEGKNGDINDMLANIMGSFGKV